MAISVDLTANPINITTGLAAGVYVAQVRGAGQGTAAIYATGEAAPDDEGAFFQAAAGESFVFRVGAGRAPTWARTAPGALSASLAIALQTVATPADAQPVSPSAADITVAGLASALGIPEPRAGTLLEAALAMVGRYAPAAPAELANEAVIRFAGYLAEASSYGAVAKDAIGPLDREFVVNHGSAFRNSGAAMLLSRWRVRRAGAIG